ncbi:conserved fungal protein [Grosmannia clavigera kw1407]|uniref:Conserved fungal protein n=1 Tax=Grosmannia clavigera (strain kw1407 / UAMH 11150) TaxID=655863 RepID=F0XC27_GROCL|nr:uncharacterized protein CMQ_926 [Grosmannia clavigera kw1407]EFX03998.1 conserved fungal protein [Grosmannia clavigera kw1407]
MAAPTDPTVAYLLSLEAVRERSREVLLAAQAGDLNHFDYHESKLPEVASFVCAIIERDFGPDKFDEIPPHGRWQHFNVGDIDRIAPLLEAWEGEGVPKLELTRRLVDLFFVSVLLDAGAGDTWKYDEAATGRAFNRSEGIAVASLHMFLEGAFSSAGKAQPLIVDGAGLVGLTEGPFVKGFQVSAENPLVGVSSRVALLNRIGSSLLRLPEIVGPTGRPGNAVDYVLKNSSEGVLDYRLLWSTLQAILIPAWPQDRPTINGRPIGDAWPLQVLAQRAERRSPKSTAAADAIQPFHKLTQWLGYSLTVPFVRILGLGVVNDQLGTGLPEYRNGGLFVDLGALTLKAAVAEANTDTAGGEVLPRFSPTEDVIVEWRAMTVALLDELFKLVSTTFAAKGTKLTMAQVLEAGTWKGGRELAAKLRPQTKSSPILLNGDGTLF